MDYCNAVSLFFATICYITIFYSFYGKDDIHFWYERAVFSVRTTGLAGGLNKP
jgi:hypothetical protein